MKFKYILIKYNNNTIQYLKDILII